MISYVKSIFDDTGLSFIWNDQIPMERNVLKNLISSKLNDQFIQKMVFANEQFFPGFILFRI